MNCMLNELYLKKAIKINKQTKLVWSLWGRIPRDWSWSLYELHRSHGRAPVDVSSFIQPLHSSHSLHYKPLDFSNPQPELLCG